MPLVHALRAVVAALLVTVTVAGCGTRLVEDRFAVRVDDPAGVLAPGPVQVAVFDSAMGQGREWALRQMGTATDARPYLGSVTSTATRLVWDRSLPTTVQAGIALPGYAPDGWFSLQTPVVDGVERRVSLPYVAYGVGPTGAATAPRPLDAVLTATPGEQGWLVSVRLEVPAAVAGP